MKLPTPRAGLRALAASLLVAALAAGALLSAPLSASAAPVTLSGVVTGPTGAPLPGVSVEALVVGAGGELATSGSVTSTAAGLFALPPLPAATYTLRFGATASTYAQYLGKTSVASESQKINLVDAAGGTPYISANLAAGGTVRGTVKTTAGKPVPKYTVTAYTAQGDVLATAKTATSGAYAFASLVPGAYRIGVADATSATPAYAPMFSGPAASLGQASEISVAQSGIATQNFALGAAGRISGVIRGDCPDATCLAGATTEVLAGVTVTPYRVSTINGSFVAERVATRARVSTASGAYALTGLAPGRYVLRLSPSGAVAASGTIYGERYLGGSDTASSASTFTIASGTALSAVNDTLTPTSTLSATFTDPANTGTSVENIRVSLILLSDLDRRVISYGFTDASGTVSLTGAATGAYLLRYGSHFDENPADTVAENTAWQAGDKIVYSYAGDSVDTGTAPIELKDPQGLHPNGTLSVNTNDPSVGGFASIVGGLYSWSSTNVTVSVQWLRNGVVVPGAVSPYYTFRAGDAGAVISARITGRNLAYGSGTVVTDAIPFITLGTMSQSQSATISGSSAVGGTVTVKPATYFVAGAVSTVVWKRSSPIMAAEVIAGETGVSHVITAADLGFDPNGDSRVSALITVTRQGYQPVTYSVASDILAEGTFTQSKAATVTATVSTFTVKAPVVAPLALATEVTWVVYDAAGAPATTTSGTTLARAGKAGKKITVTVRTQRPGYTPRVVTLVVQNAPAPIVTGSLAITGTPMVDSPLTAPAVVFTPALDKAPLYQWSYYSSKKKWTNIAGATQSTFTPTAAYKGLRLRVVITGAGTGYLTRTVISNTTAVVAAGSGLGVITQPVVSAAPAFNQTISVTTGSWSPAPTSYSYQWKVSGSDGTPTVPIAGATKASYLIPSASLGKTYAVTVTANRAGYPSISTTVVAGAVSTGTIKNLTLPKFVESSPGHYVVTSNGTWSNPALSYSYEWRVAIPETGAISGPMVITTAVNQEPFDATTLPNEKVYLVVRANGPAASLGSTAPIFVRKGVLEGNGVGIADGGDAVEVNEKVSVSPVNWMTFGATTKSYQWQLSSSTDPVPPAASWSNLAGGTTASFTATAALMDKQIRVRVVGRAPGYTDTIAYSPPKIVYPSFIAQPTGDAILGSATVGSTLSFKPAAFAAGWKVSYEWWTLTGSGWAKTATGGTYTPTAPIAVRVRVTAVRPGYLSLDYNTSPVVVGSGVIRPLVLPVVTKSAAGAYTVTPGSYTPASTPTIYHWTVTSATGVENTLYAGGPTWTPPAAHDGKLVTVAITVHSDNQWYPNIVITKVARPATSAIEWTSDPYLDGGKDVGQTLAFTGGTWSMPNPTLSYVWRRNGVAIVGQTAATYSPVAADIGKTISLAVTASRVNFGSATRVVAASSVTLSDVVLQATTSPAVTGSAVVGGALTATPGMWSVPGVGVAYQWVRNGSPIAGATTTSYTVGAADLGQDVAVRVTAGKANNYFPVPVTSPSLHIGYGTFATVGGVTIGKPAPSYLVGKPVGATLSGWAKNATLTYQWELSPDGTNFEPILGATGRTYTPAVPGYTRLTVTASAPGFTTQSTSTVTIRIS
ncbi:carboxypeptidase regulatory-like domain-containing protein [Glaciihabitans arcticus]|uniref:alpha-amylase n=1 Tax=Glaciihabitans arcticus TaxID=2668039 RepID=A0A4Q9GNJ2_9MICO|nr:carboxypeptidase regulatory-like domain-containing protein [Glaciihabitans arcticus]TBN56276.1 carboxypeptidase regulatory-like domain-containing protein [Glaciihabitans arcticus]